MFYFLNSCSIWLSESLSTRFKQVLAEKQKFFTLWSSSTRVFVSSCEEGRASEEGVRTSDDECLLLVAASGVAIIEIQAKTYWNWLKKIQECTKSTDVCRRQMYINNERMYLQLWKMYVQLTIECIYNTDECVSSWRERVFTALKNMTRWLSSTCIYKDSRNNKYRVGWQKYCITCICICIRITVRNITSISAQMLILFFCNFGKNR